MTVLPTCALPAIWGFGVTDGGHGSYGHDAHADQTDVHLDHSTLDDSAVVAEISREPATQSLTLGMLESATATILEILQEIDPHGYLAEGGAPNAYYTPASFLGWNVHDVKGITSEQVLARVETAFGWDRESPPADLSAAYVEIADRIVTDVVRPLRKQLGGLMLEVA
jgi:hypothetical protein